MSTAAPFPDPVTIHTVPLPTPAQLPNDPETLKRLLVELLATLRAERQDKEALQHRLHLLLHRLYGPRQERFNPDQLLLFAEGTADNDAAASATAPAAAESGPRSGRERRSAPHGRGRLSDKLPRRPVHHELSEAERLCVCGQVRVDIGADVSEQVDYQPASLFVQQHWTHKYVCPRCRGKTALPATDTSNSEPATAMTEPTTPSAHPSEPAATAELTAALSEATANAATTAAATVTTMSATNAAAPPAPAAPLPVGPAVISAPKPPGPFAKGLPGPGLLAFVIVGKYFDHLPLHRQENILARQGLAVSRSTLCDWMAASAELLRPLYELMAAAVLQSQWLHTDDTPVKNQGHAPDATALSRFWIYLGDRTHPYNVFDFTVNRKRDGPQSFLADFRGYLHADAFSGYDALYLPSPRAGVAPIIEVACNAHARRKFHEARGSDCLALASGTRVLRPVLRPGARCQGEPVRRRPGAADAPGLGGADPGQVPHLARGATHPGVA
jgi:transposase